MTPEHFFQSQDKASGRSSIFEISRWCDNGIKCPRQLTNTLASGKCFVLRGKCQVLLVTILSLVWRSTNRTVFSSAVTSQSNQTS